MAVLKDSGERREFDSGAVRDIQEGKGRCDLLPLDIVASLMDNQDAANTLYYISKYMILGKDENLFLAIRSFCIVRGWSIPDAILEVAKQYEDGANKYGERNWEKGISLHCYIDSGVRHLLKYLAGWTDEPHDRAFIWNMLGAIWTHKWMPNLRDTPAFMTQSQGSIDMCKRRETEIDKDIQGCSIQVDEHGSPDLRDLVYCTSTHSDECNITDKG